MRVARCSSTERRRGWFASFALFNTFCTRNETVTLGRKKEGFEQGIRVRKVQVKHVDFIKGADSRSCAVIIREGTRVYVYIGPSVAEMDTRRDSNDVAERDVANRRALRRNQETDNPCYKVSERYSRVAWTQVRTFRSYCSFCSDTHLCLRKGVTTTM